MQGYRMLKKTIGFIALFCLLAPVLVHADPLLGGFLTEVPRDVIRDVSTQAEQRAAVNRSVGGITLSYGGYRDVTNYDGYYHFPQHHTGTTLELIITTGVKAQKKEKTISHLMLDDSRPASFFRFEKKPDNKGRWYWQATTSSKPADGIIPASTIILFADPKHIYVNIHEHLFTAENNQLILPHNSIYVLANELADLGDLEKATQLVDATQQFAEVVTAAPAEGGETGVVEQAQVSGH
jgi:hypothetical protein